MTKKCDRTTGSNKKIQLFNKLSSLLNKGKKQAGAELGQAQAKLEVTVEVVVKVCFGVEV